jgi:iron-sulfur cluster assembly protein
LTIQQEFGADYSPIVRYTALIIFQEFFMAVNVTESAAREINAIVNQQNLDPEKIRLRVGVKGGGCSGFSYLLDLTETQKDSDEMWEFTYTLPTKGGKPKAAEAEAGGEQGGVAVAQESGESFTVRVICDPKSYLYLNGTTIDFKDEIMGRGFVFNNPNATSSCGCGSSFSA